MIHWRGDSCAREVGESLFRVHVEEGSERRGGGGSGTRNDMRDCGKRN